MVRKIKKIGEFYGKPMVVGNPNHLKKHEILVEETVDGKIADVKSIVNGKIDSIVKAGAEIGENVIVFKFVDNASIALDSCTEPPYINGSKNSPILGLALLDYYKKLGHREALDYCNTNFSTVIAYNKDKNRFYIPQNWYIDEPSQLDDKTSTAYIIGIGKLISAETNLIPSDALDYLVPFDSDEYKEVVNTVISKLM